MDWGAIGNLGLAGVAVVALAWVVVERSKKAEAKDEAPIIPADVFAKIVGAAVSEANKPFRELVANNTEAIENNTRAITDMRVANAKISGKADTILRDTQQLLLRSGHGGGGEC